MTIKEHEEDQTPFSEAQRKLGQKAAILTNLPTRMVGLIVGGEMMMLYANDVLGYTTKEVSGLLAIIPLINLFLPLLFLSHIRRLGKVKAVRIAFLIRVLIVVGLILIPTSQLNLTLYFVLLLLFSMVQRLGQGTVWQPLLKDITTNSDRGRFFARMRFIFNLVATITSGVIPLMVGESMTAVQYKIFLVIAVIGLLNQAYWVGKIPDKKEVIRDKEKHREHRMGGLLKTLRTSPLLRRPLFIVLLMTVTGLPMYVLYLRKVLLIPSNIVGIFIFTTILGSTISLLGWGKVSDILGFRPTLIGLLLLTLPLPFLQFFLAPFPDQAPSFMEMNHVQMVTVIVLFVHGFVTGALGSGTGIATTSIMHYHVQSDDSLEAMNLHTIFVMLFSSLVTIFAGFWLADVVVPYGSHAFLNGSLHLDCFKGYLIFVGIPLKCILLWQVSKLPNTRSHFGVGDFFNIFSISSVRSVISERFIHHSNDDKRRDTAFLFGRTFSPVSVDPLVVMLTDPDYDVKVEAIRGLARSNSTLAEEKLLELFNDSSRSHLADQVAWALGELRSKAAVPSLIEHLGDGYANRIRAMSARALGKMGADEAIDALVGVLSSCEKGQHLIASASRAMLQLAWSEHACLLFEALRKLEKREERFELMSALCTSLNIDNHWVVSATSEMSLSAALINSTNALSTIKQQEYAATIRALNDRDFEVIRKLFKASIQDAKSGISPVMLALESSLASGEQWQPMAVLAAAKLLHSS